MFQSVSCSVVRGGYSEIGKGSVSSEEGDRIEGKKKAGGGEVRGREIEMKESRKRQGRENLEARKTTYLARFADRELRQQLASQLCD